MPTFGLGILGSISVNRDKSNSAASREIELEPSRESACNTEARRVAHAYEPSGFSKVFGVRDSNWEQSSHKFSGDCVDDPSVAVKASAATTEKNDAFL